MLWERSYGGRQADYLADVIATADYGFLLAGSSLSGQTGNKLAEGRGNIDFCIWKMDEHGVQEWQKSFGGDGVDMLRSIQLTGDGGFILAGISNSQPSQAHGRQEHKTEACRGGNDYWVVKLDAYGNEQWQKTIGGSGQDDLSCIRLTRDGGYILGGSSSSGATSDKKAACKGNMDYWLVKLDKYGKVEWDRSYGGKYADVLQSLEPTADGGYIVGGTSNSPQGHDKSSDSYNNSSDYWILKLDKDGGIEWQQTYGGEGDDQLFALRPAHEKGYIVGGSSASDVSGTKNRSNKNGTDFWVLMLDEDGYVKWQQTYDFGSADMLTSIVVNRDGTFLIGGYAKAEPGKKKDSNGINDYIALKLSKEGEVLWEYTVGSEGEDILRRVTETRDGGYILAGTSNPEFKRVFLNDPNGSVTGKAKPLKFGSGKNIAIADEFQSAIDDAVNSVANKVNDFVGDKVNSVTKGINDGIAKATGQKEDSRVKFGVNAPVGQLMNFGKSGSGAGGADPIQEMLERKGPKKGLDASRTKKTNYGNKDFWVVKLGDRQKKTQEREMIEAFPNPIDQITNVIVGFEFDHGTISVFDISGRRLQHFAIKDRTVPVSISGYMQGIYVIKVDTNRGEASIKVIKR